MIVSVFAPVLSAQLMVAATGRPHETLSLQPTPDAALPVDMILQSIKKQTTKNHEKKSDKKKQKGEKKEKTEDKEREFVFLCFLTIRVTSLPTSL